MKVSVCVSTLLFIIVSSGSAYQLNSSNYHLRMNVNINAMELSPFFGTPVAIEEERRGAGRVNPAVMSSIQTGIGLGGLGTVVWSIGCILQIATISQAISSTSDNEVTSEEASSVSNLMLWATVLSVLGPLPSCIGESMAIGTLNATAGDGIRYFTRGWGSYGISWVFTGTSFLLGSVSYGSGEDGAIMAIMANVLALTAEIFRGRAAILPVMNLSKIKARLYGNFSSGVDGRQQTGVVLSYTF